VCFTRTTIVVPAGFDADGDDHQRPLGPPRDRTRSLAVQRALEDGQCGACEPPERVGGDPELVRDGGPVGERPPLDDVPVGHAESVDARDFDGVPRGVDAIEFAGVRPPARGEDDDGVPVGDDLFDVPAVVGKTGVPVRPAVDRGRATALVDAATRLADVDVVSEQVECGVGSEPLSIASTTRVATCRFSASVYGPADSIRVPRASVPYHFPNGVTH
jgi:hypothetical protein